MTDKAKRISWVEATTRFYAEARAHLAEVVGELEAAIAEQKRSRLDSIKTRVNAAIDARDRLQNALKQAADDGLFAKPKTRTFHGIRVGVKKQSDVVEIDDEARTIDRIRKLLPDDQAELLIRRKETVDRNAVRDLTDADLKRLGIRLVPGEDQVFIKPQDSEVSKLVDALLGKGEELEEI